MDSSDCSDGYNIRPHYALLKDDGTWSEPKQIDGAVAFAADLQARTGYTIPLQGYEWVRPSDLPQDKFAGAFGEVKLLGDASPDFTQCPLSVPTTEFEKRAYESGSIAFELEHFNEDLIKEIFGKPSDPRFCVRYSRSITYLYYPRTVREAKARRKGNRGNRKREYSVARMDVTIPNASITHTSDGTHEVSWDVHDG